ncbi:MAG TPA: DeoR family transcriptional regulator [Verrucomicrobiae bacterium]|nr:DeoR family transcriptional regulator [Verrucomicrobiae bacterium]
MSKLLTRPLIERLLTTAAALASKQGIKTRELAELFEVSEKTIHRDREFIQNRLMIDLDLDRDGFRYRARNTAQAQGIAMALQAMVGRGIL